MPDDGWRTEYRVRCASNPKHLPIVLPRLQAAEDLVDTYSRTEHRLRCGPHVIEQRVVAVGAWSALVSTPPGGTDA